MTTLCRSFSIVGLTKWSSAASVASPLQRRVRPPHCSAPTTRLRAVQEDGRGFWCEEAPNLSDVILGECQGQKSALDWRETALWARKANRIECVKVRGRPGMLQALAGRRLGVVQNRRERVASEAGPRCRAGLPRWRRGSDAAARNERRWAGRQPRGRLDGLRTRLGFVAIVVDESWRDGWLRPGARNSTKRQ